MVQVVAITEFEYIITPKHLLDLPSKTCKANYDDFFADGTFELFLTVKHPGYNNYNINYDLNDYLNIDLNDICDNYEPELVGFDDSLVRLTVDGGLRYLNW